MSRVNIDVGGSGNPDFTFVPSGGVAGLNMKKTKMHPKHCQDIVADAARNNLPAFLFCRFLLLCFMLL